VLQAELRRHAARHGHRDVAEQHRGEHREGDAHRHRGGAGRLPDRALRQLGEAGRRAGREGAHRAREPDDRLAVQAEREGARLRHLVEQLAERVRLGAARRVDERAEADAGGDARELPGGERRLQRHPRREAGEQPEGGLARGRRGERSEGLRRRGDRAARAGPGRPGDGEREPELHARRHRARAEHRHGEQQPGGPERHEREGPRAGEPELHVSPPPSA
jgi:hypothetical protein